MQCHLWLPRCFGIPSLLRPKTALPVSTRRHTVAVQASENIVRNLRLRYTIATTFPLEHSGQVGLDMIGYDCLQAKFWFGNQFASGKISEKFSKKADKGIRLDVSCRVFMIPFDKRRFNTID